MLDRNLKAQIFEEITSIPKFLGKYEEQEGILIFLNKIWDLKALPSEDSRYKNAYDDSHKHLVNNSDWSIKDTFLNRFKLLDGEEIHFISFLESIVHPTVREKEEIPSFVARINKFLQPAGSKLTLTDYFEGLPVYRYKTGTEINDLPIDIIPNKLKIYYKIDESLDTYPCFFLKNDPWDDYSQLTTFILIYKNSFHESDYFGKVKIMQRGTNVTKDALPENFTSLSEEWCSLGQSNDYYLKLKQVLKSDYYSFLLAIRDVAIFPKIYEAFESDEIFKTSLIRRNSAEQLARTIRFEIEGINSQEYFKFNYTHRPGYSTNDITLNFNFEYNTDFEHRIYALIGKNGTGKTTILSSLAKNLSESAPVNFTPRKPIYGKIFTVSYSFFDQFEIPTADAAFNYVYCGLKKNNKEWKTKDELISDFYQAAVLIKKKDLENEWYQILTNFINVDILNIAFETREDFFSKESNYFFIEAKFVEINRILSSGQSIILYLISEILSQIRYDSLILFDEPETHLHPNSITALINTLYSIVDKFKSFCILATHSPIIIQEIPSRNIFVIERTGEYSTVRKLEKESLGENLTVITQDIFGTREIPKHFIILVQELLSKGKSYDEIISILESDNLPVSSNIRLYIKTLAISPQ
jgi:predicted ATPase